MRQKHCWNYFAFNQSYLAEGKIAPVVLLSLMPNKHFLVKFWKWRKALPIWPLQAEPILSKNA